MGGKNLLDKFRKVFKKDKQEEIDEKYVFVSESEINEEELKRNIVELERLGDERSKVLQRKYGNILKAKENKNLRIWVCRYIDGDEEEDLISERCLKKSIISNSNRLRRSKI